MGSFCQGGNTVLQDKTYTANPYTAQFAQNVGATAGNLPGPGQVPLQGVADLNNYQTSGLAGLYNTGMNNPASPYFNAASNYLSQSADPNVTNQLTAGFYNPMANNVFANLADVFGQQRVQDTGNLTQTAGGVGADRIGVGQANLAKEQGLAAGQTAANLYSQAQAAAMQQQGLTAGAGSVLGSLAPSVLGAQLQGYGASVGAGNQLQGQQQNILNALFNQQSGQYQNPFQVLGAQTGTLGSLAGALGGTQNGTTTYPPTSPFGTIAGLGVAGLGLASKFAASGGRISPWGAMEGYDDGGGIFVGPNSGFDTPDLSKAPKSPMQQMTGQLNQLPKGGTINLSGLGSKLNDLSGGLTSNFGFNSGTSPDSFASSPDKLFPGYIGGSGDVDPNLSARGGRAYADGGSDDDGSDTDMAGTPLNKIEPSVVRDRGYRELRNVMARDTGGDNNDMDRAQGTEDAFRIPGSAFSNPWKDPTLHLPKSVPDRIAGLTSLTDENGLELPENVTPTSGTRGEGLPALPNLITGPTPTNDRLATNPWLQMGLGILANSGQRDAHGLPIGGSPLGQLGHAVGAGGLQGIKGLEEARKQDQTERQLQNQAEQQLYAAKMQQVPYSQMTANQRAQLDFEREKFNRPYQDLTAAERARDDLAREQFNKKYTDLTANEQAQVDAKKDELALKTKEYELKALTPVPYGRNIWGQPVMGVRDPKTNQILDPKTMQPLDLSQIKEPDEESLMPMAEDIANYRSQMPSGYKRLSPAGALLERMVKDINPDWNQQLYASSQAARNEFARGVRGRTVTAMNVGIDHLDALEKYARALETGEKDPRILTALRQEFEKQFGHSPPVVFDAAKDIVGAEVSKAIVGSQNALTDRQEIRDQLNKANSWGQISDTIKAYKRLMAGQLAGQRLHYEYWTKSKDFDSQLSDRARSELTGLSRSDLEEAKKAAGDPKEIADKDKAALEWANAHPEDPRSAKIKERLGVK